jgi:hypothetical protein
MANLRREIEIHEWPSGCELIQSGTDRGVMISTIEDADAIIESLQRMKQSLEEVATQ